MANASGRQDTQGSKSKLQSLTPGQWGVLAGAAALSIFGLTRKSKAGMAMAAAGGLIAYKGAKAGSGKKDTAHASFAINCSPETAYQFWHNFENLPRFMRHLQSVKMTGENRSEWTADGPMGKSIRWTAETTEDQANQRIAWQSTPGSDVQTTGSVEFRPATAGRGTIVRATVRYSAPGGSAGRAIAMLAGKHPEFTVREDLRRFKAILETGETPTTRGQSHGPRGVHGKTERVMFREPQNQPEPQVDSQAQAGSQAQGGVRRSA